MLLPAPRIVEPLGSAPPAGSVARFEPADDLPAQGFELFCDRDGVHQIDIAQRKISAFYPIPDGEFINDIALAENGDLYVSDFFANRIYRLPQKTRVVETVLAQLQHRNWGSERNAIHWRY